MPIPLRAKKGITSRLVVNYLSSGQPATGLSVSLRILRKSDDKYLNSDGSWTATPGTDPSTTEWSSSDMPGVYYFDFQLPDAPDAYLAHFDGGTSVSNRHQYFWLEAMPSDESDLHRVKAVLANNQEQEISTGIVTIKDDDGATALLTMTPGVDVPDSPTKNVLTVSDA